MIKCNIKYRSCWWYKVLIIILLLIALYDTYGQAEFRFTENKGQWDSNVLYKLRNHSGATFLENDGITFNFMEQGIVQHAGFTTEDFEPGKIPEYHAYKVSFVNCNKGNNVTGHHKSFSYDNFYLGKDPDLWKSRVYSYYNVEYYSIYNGVDLMIYSVEDNLKYDFIVNQGADPNQIVLKYDGVDKIRIRKSNLIITTSLNTVTEFKPYVYQIIENDTIVIKCKYKLRNNEVRFELRDSYDDKYDLIIDPFLVFSTYSGSTADNWGFTATFDSLGNVYSGGIVAGIGYPSTLGAYQDTFAGGDPFTIALWDIGIIKYDSTGTQRLWATYLGGTGDEMPHSLIVDGNNELLILGTTGSADFPVTLTAYDTSFNGGDALNYSGIGFSNGSDIIVTKLSEDGSDIIASSYVGGSGNDGLNFRNAYGSSSILLQLGNDSLYYNYGDGARGEILIDDENNIIIGSCTFSTDFPYSTNAFQTTSNGKQEGVIFKLDSSLTTLLWGSYIGGSRDDAIYSIDIDNQNNVYAGGGTNSPDINTTLGVIFPDTIGGSADGLVAKISSDGTTLINASYFGSDEYDQIYFVKVDEDSKVFITGQTKALDSTLIINDPYYNNPNSGQFIAKLTSNLDSIEWSTVFGTGNGKPNISITAFAVDNTDRIYLSGWGRDWNLTEGTTGMDVTPSAYQSVTDGQDFYLMILADDASCLKYATFFGELHYSSCPNSGQDHVDGGTSRFDKRGYIYQAACASCDLIPSSTIGCQEFPTYPANVWSTSNNSLNCNNAVFKFELESPVSLPDLHVCNDESAILGFASNDPYITYNWSPVSLLSNPNIYNPVTSSTNDTIFMLTMESHYCIDTIYQSYFKHSLALEIPDTLEMCDYDSVFLNPIITLDFANIQWSEFSDFSNTINNISNSIWAAPDSTLYYYCKAFNEYCEVTDSVLIIVHNVSINAIPDFVICYGDSVELSAISHYPGQEIIYTWQPEDVILSGQNTPNPFIFIEDTTQFFVTALNVEGNCIDQDNLTVSLSPFSLSDYEIIPLIIDSVFETQSILIIADSIENYAYLWFPSGELDDPILLNVIATPANSNYFYVSVTDEYGCVRIDSIYIFVEDVYCNEDHVYVPNAFSPNGDNYNDILYVQSRMTNDVFFVVYDRWGEKVFETKDLSIGWDGTYKGQALAPDVFVFYLQAGCWNGSRFEKKGNVTLLR